MKIKKITTYLSVSYFLIIFAFLFIVVLLIGITLNKELSINIQNENMGLAISVGNTFDLYLDETENLIKTVRDQLGYIEMVEDKLDNYLKYYLKNYNQIKSVKILEEERKVVYTYPNLPFVIGSDLSREDFSIDVLENKVNWSDSYIDRDSGEPALTASIAMNEKLIVFDINIGIFNNLLAGLDKNSYINIYDNKGTVIASTEINLVYFRENHSNKHHIKEALKGESITYNYFSSVYNENVLVSSIPLKNNWVISVSKASKEANHIIYSIIRMFIITGFIIILIGVFISVHFSKKVKVPLNKIIEWSKNLSEGNYSVKKFNNDFFEFEILLKSFEFMAEEINKREIKLKKTNEEIEEKLIMNKHAQKLGNFGYWEWDLLKKEQYWTEEYYRIFDLDPFEIEPSYENFINFIHKDDREKLVAHSKKLLEEKQSFDNDLFFRIITQKGKEKYIHNFFEVLYNEKNVPYKIIGTIHDVTKIKKIENELIKQKENAEKANEAKTEFLSKVSHELRTPMVGIIGGSQIASISSDINEIKENIKLIELSANRLLPIINDILELSKIEKKQIDFNKKELEINTFLESALKPFEFSSKNKGINFYFFNNLEKNLWVLADESRINQIINNIVGNAIKFTEFGKIEITVNSEEQNDNKIKLTFKVKDTGLGISEKFKNKIFTPFEQEETYITRKFQGTGLGLSISKEIIEKMNGSITFQSELKKGTEFLFYIELEKMKN